MKKTLRQINTPTCRYCGSNTEVRKHGKGNSQLQRYRCMACLKTFQMKYIYLGHEVKYSNLAI
ncbi:transposase [Budvicia aquatica]|uniref:Transposase and inactivated derivatives n=1 Tax=Budvicia aquatica TaxID=82979 RepID=A0A484ZL70_9GAMM|nr:hypothetical protein SOASR029_37220 [Budvicia aquatica]VFS46479.1 Transposase and inactivated derivatives [Budvicia aquatica]